jgi:hypothetical protein
MVPAELDDWGQVYAGALPHAPGFSALGTSGKGEGTGPKPGPPYRLWRCGALGLVPTRALSSQQAVSP